MKKIVQVFVGYTLLISISLILYSKILVFFNLPNNLILFTLLLLTLLIIRIGENEKGYWFEFKIILPHLHLN